MEKDISQAHQDSGYQIPKPTYWHSRSHDELGRLYLHPNDDRQEAVTIKDTTAVTFADTFLGRVVWIAGEQGSQFEESPSKTFTG